MRKYAESLESKRKCAEAEKYENVCQNLRKCDKSWESVLKVEQVEKV